MPGITVIVNGEHRDVQAPGDTPLRGGMQPRWRPTGMNSITSRQTADSWPCPFVYRHRRVLRISVRPHRSSQFGFMLRETRSLVTR
jgi:hypothetical protein